MKLAVIGSGVVGVTTAFELRQDGHDVTVFEKCSTVAEGASFANGGLLAPEWSATLASDRWARKPPSTGSSWWSRLRRAEPPASVDPGPSLLALTRLGAERLDELCERLQLTPDSHQGMMVVWRDARESAQAERMQAQVRQMGGECHLMGADQARALELALSPDTALSGALVLPHAWSVNCRQFTMLLRARAQQDGCRFEFRKAVQFLQSGTRFQLADENRQVLPDTYDGVVVCAGAATGSMLRSAGIALAMETRLGFGLNAAIRESLDAPVAVVQDLKHRVSIARMGPRVRVTSPLMRDSGKEVDASTFKRLHKVLDDWFPGSIQRGSSNSIQQWRTEVATTSDGLPLIGAAPVPGIWVNTGHGIHGWAMACSSARLLADQVAGHASCLDATPYRVVR